MLYLVTTSSFFRFKENVCGKWLICLASGLCESINFWCWLDMANTGQHRPDIKPASRCAHRLCFRGKAKDLCEEEVHSASHNIQIQIQNSCYIGDTDVKKIDSDSLC